MTAEDNAVALKALLTAESAAPYELDELKALAPLPAGYNEFTLSERFVGELRNVGSTGRRGWRATTRAVGTTVENSREMRKRAQDGLRFARITVNGAASTPIQLESEEPIGEDNGYYSGLTTWVFAI